MNIFIDFDNTIVDTTDAFIKQYNIINNTSINPDDVTEYDFYPTIPIKDKNKISEMFTTDLFFENLLLYNNVEESLRRLKNIGCNLILVTNCSNKSATQKIKWLMNHSEINNLFDAKLFVCINKPYDKSTINMENSILIDDHKLNHIGSNALYKFAYRDRPNRNWYPDATDGVVVKDDWLSIANEIEKIVFCQNKNNTK